MISDSKLEVKGGDNLVIFANFEHALSKIQSASIISDNAFKICKSAFELVIL